MAFALGGDAGAFGLGAGVVLPVGGVGAFWAGAGGVALAVGAGAGGSAGALAGRVVALAAGATGFGVALGVGVDAGPSEMGGLTGGEGGAFWAGREGAGVAFAAGGASTLAVEGAAEGGVVVASLRALAVGPTCAGFVGAGVGAAASVAFGSGDGWPSCWLAGSLGGAAGLGFGVSEAASLAFVAASSRGSWPGRPAIGAPGGGVRSKRRSPCCSVSSADGSSGAASSRASSSSRASMSGRSSSHVESVKRRGRSDGCRRGRDTGLKKIETARPPSQPPLPGRICRSALLQDPVGSVDSINAPRRIPGGRWSSRTKATWSVGLAIAGSIIVACGVLAIVLGYIARQEAEVDGDSAARTRGTLGMALGVVGVLVAITWMTQFWGG